MSKKNNALAELAERMHSQYDSQPSWWQDDQDGKDFYKAQRIVAELAKVEEGKAHVMRIPLSEAVVLLRRNLSVMYYRCREIAEEGARDANS